VTNGADPRSWAFPFDLLYRAEFPGTVGAFMEQIHPIACNPPFPWGYWTYSRVLETRVATLPGDILEAGVGRGGMSLLLGLLVKHLRLEKKVIAVDSFEGLPEPQQLVDNRYFERGDYSRKCGPEAWVREFWLRAAVLGLGDIVEPVRGFFAEALPKLEPDRCFCFVHIDGDLFGSVRTALDHLYDRVVDGGVVVIDDFFHPAQGPLRATVEFFNERGLAPVYHIALPYSAFVFKGEAPEAKGSARAVDGNFYSFDWLRTDPHLAALVERSRERSRDLPRALEACELFLELLRREPRYADIYDYWRALEAYWEAIDQGEPRRRARSATTPLVGSGSIAH
jgi:hypothetical protein